MRALWIAFLRNVSRHRAHAGMFGASFLLVSAGWLWASLALRGTGEPLILHWSDYTGITQVGGVGELSAMGAFGLVAILMNAVIAFDLENRDRVWGKIVAAGTAFFAVLIFISFVAIIAVN